LALLFVIYPLCNCQVICLGGVAAIVGIRVLCVLAMPEGVVLGLFVLRFRMVIPCFFTEVFIKILCCLI